ncbi:hypothetical protein [Haliangium ochraceum]|uniref:Uncharacterized protein n=1 Tax=Haliangium ochraceum (strain DSM 14365 / JCM 11303 / SMP-2) TaxID=502025 RepID=D0LV92_HALO1|nr:hypothetical protein [Haliangium ochraceum]ACY15933.1 hypothetical protein Hoch_3431 [Haliangium ochraceum DSM 14365]
MAAGDDTSARGAASGPMEVPISTGVRLARVVALLALDLALAGAGLLMIGMYVRDCASASQTSTAPTAHSLRVVDDGAAAPLRGSAFDPTEARP